MSAPKKAKPSLATKYKQIGEAYAEEMKHHVATASPLAGKFTLGTGYPLHPMYGSEEERQHARKKSSTGLLRLMGEKSVRTKKQAKLGKDILKAYLELPESAVVEMSKQHTRYTQQLENLQRRLKSKLADD